MDDGHETETTASGQPPAQATTDFGVLHVDLHVRAEIRKAPNPLRAASPERLKRYRDGVDGVVAARRAGFGDR